MKNKIYGVEYVYRLAIEKPDENIVVSASFITELIEKYRELQNTVIAMKESLLACQETAEDVLEQHKNVYVEKS